LCRSVRKEAGWQDPASPPTARRSSRLEGLSEAVAGEVAPFGVRVLIVEPGNFRTGLLGSGLHTATPIEAYATTVGVTRSYFASEDGRQLGDPAKAATAIIAALDADEPPLRLVLGTDALEGIRAKYEELNAELTRWENLARSTAFDSRRASGSHSAMDTPLRIAAVDVPSCGIPPATMVHLCADAGEVRHRWFPLRQAVFDRRQTPRPLTNP
jgi:hypothetical protein